ncbi:MAG: pyridoxamine 5'-phosphate oxidase family protein [Candidatus Thorarchaeota archaeon]|jgi:uncharacterized pyridoxamine 5'-phosphate oxidase family protein
MPVEVLGDELPQNAYELLRTKPIDVVIATVDEDGFPRTAPYGLIRALDRKTLRVGIGPGKRTYANIVRNGKVMVCVLAEGNIALGIRGRARVIKERMESWNIHVAMIEIDILEVKSDALTWVPITQGIQVQLSDEIKERAQKGRDELLAFNPSS